MPIKRSAMKALRQSTVKAARNLQAKKKIKDLVKKTTKVIDLKDAAGAKDKAKEAIKAIDKAIQKKIIKKNAGARKKSRLMKKINLLK